MLVGLGVAGGAATLLIPVERYDADGALIGEMPAAFGLSLLLVVLGLVGLLTGLAVWGVRRALDLIAQNRT